METRRRRPSRRARGASIDVWLNSARSSDLVLSLGELEQRLRRLRSHRIARGEQQRAERAAARGEKPPPVDAQPLGAMCQSAITRRSRRSSASLIRARGSRWTNGRAFRASGDSVFVVAAGDHRRDRVRIDREHHEDVADRQRDEQQHRPEVPVARPHVAAEQVGERRELAPASRSRCP